MTYVKNVNGSDRFSAPSGYDSWLDYWEKYTGKKISYCSVTTCSRSDIVGAHVQKANSTDEKYYIVPICKGCNQRTDSFYVTAELAPVPSNA